MRGPTTLDICGLEQSATDPATNLFQGRLYWNTATNRARIYDGSAWNSFTQKYRSTDAGEWDGTVTLVTYDVSSSKIDDAQEAIWELQDTNRERVQGARCRPTDATTVEVRMGSTGMEVTGAFTLVGIG